MMEAEVAKINDRFRTGLAKLSIWGSISSSRFDRVRIG